MIAGRPDIQECSELEAYNCRASLNRLQESKLGSCQSSTGGQAGKADRFGSGDTRPFDPQDGCLAANAWMGDRAAYPAGVEGSLAGTTGRALPGAAPAGATGLDSREVGRVGKQSSREVLLAYSRWRQVSSATGGAVEPVVRGD